jgi:pimeloyl-ACP methyl ester carboxylesterase
MQPLVSSYLGLSPQGFHNVHYLQWGRADNDQVVICVHGVSRNAHDFDYLAKELSTTYRVLCPDVVGRGKSDWLHKPELYTYSQYLSDMTALIARSGAEKVAWIGTSMGGIIGMLIAAQPSSPIECLVLNDVGPYLSLESLKRILEYLKAKPEFSTLQEAELYFREILSPFGSLTEEQWHHLIKFSIKQDADGKYRVVYDPAIGQSDIGKSDMDLWALWGKITCPILLIRGKTSDILSTEVAKQMQQTKKNLDFLEIAEAGHAPALMSADQVTAIKKWLLAHI